MTELNSVIRVVTQACVFCGKSGYIDVPFEAFIDWKVKGQFIQDAMPELSDGEREQILTGTHDECFNENFSEEE